MNLSMSLFLVTVVSMFAFKFNPQYSAYALLQQRRLSEKLSLNGLREFS